MKNILLRPRWATKALAGTIVLGLAATAQAQPGGGGGGGNRPNFQNMTPEQREAFQQQMETRRNERRSAWLKQAMSASGVTDAAAQTAVVDYLTAADKSKTSLRDQARALSALLIKPESTDAEITAALKAYREAVAAAKAKKIADLKTLDEVTKYSTTPRVETLLTLLGVLGDETETLGGIGEIFPESPYGNMGGGGRGGGQGGPGGGGMGGPGGGGQGGGGRGQGGRGGGRRGGGGGQGGGGGDMAPAGP